MHRTITIVAALAVLLVAAQLHAQNLRDLPIPEPPRMPEPPRIWPPTPPRLLPVELKGYIVAVVVDPVYPWRYPGRTEYYFVTVDGQRYWLVWHRARLYLCGPFNDYVGTGKLVIVKGYLLRWWRWPIPLLDGVLFAVEIRDPAYPHCR